MQIAWMEGVAPYWTVGKGVLLTYTNCGPDPDNPIAGRSIRINTAGSVFSERFNADGTYVYGATAEGTSTSTADLPTGTSSFDADGMWTTTFDPLPECKTGRYRVRVIMVGGKPVALNLTEARTLRDAMDPAWTGLPGSQPTRALPRSAVPPVVAGPPRRSRNPWTGIAVATTLVAGGLGTWGWMHSAKAPPLGAGTWARRQAWAARATPSTAGFGQMMNASTPNDAQNSDRRIVRNENTRRSNGEANEPARVVTPTSETSRPMVAPE